MKKEGWNFGAKAPKPASKTVFAALFKKADKLRRELREKWAPVPVPRVYEKLVEYQHLQDLESLSVIKDRESSIKFPLDPKASHQYWIDWKVPASKVMCISDCNRGDGDVWFSIFIPNDGDYSTVQTEPLIMLTDAGGACFPFLTSMTDFVILLSKGFYLEVINDYLESEEIGAEHDPFGGEDDLKHETSYKSFMKWLVDFFHVDSNKDLVPEFVATRNRYSAMVEKWNNDLVNGPSAKGH